MKRVSKIINHEHDAGYKSIFSKKRNFIHFLQKYIKTDWVSQIDGKSLELIDKSFIESDFTDRESDIIYKLNFKGSDIIFYVLLELQSTVNFTMPFRLLKYITEMLKREFDNTSTNIRESKDYRLPAVVPIILYNGADNWNVVKSFKEYSQGYENFGEYIIDFKYLLFDLNRTSNDIILSTNNLLDMVFSLDKNSSRTDREKALQKIAGELNNISGEDKTDILRWIKYIWLNRVGNEQTKDELLNDLEKGDITKMIYGIDRAFDEERRKGETKATKEYELKRKKEMTEIAEKLLKINTSIENIIDITGLTEKEVLQIKSPLKDVL